MDCSTARIEESLDGLSLHGGRDRAPQEGVRFTGPMTVGASGLGSGPLNLGPPCEEVRWRLRRRPCRT